MTWCLICTGITLPFTLFTCYFSIVSLYIRTYVYMLYQCMIRHRSYVNHFSPIVIRHFLPSLPLCILYLYLLSHLHLYSYTISFICPCYRHSSPRNLAVALVSSVKFSPESYRHRLLFFSWSYAQARVIERTRECKRLEIGSRLILRPSLLWCRIFSY
jgi:hypothetical protein